MVEDWLFLNSRNTMFGLWKTWWGFWWIRYKCGFWCYLLNNYGFNKPLDKIICQLAHIPLYTWRWWRYVSIRIGDNNKIVKSKIIENNDNSPNGLRSILITAAISLFVGFILVFCFWGDIVSWIEGLFRWCRWKEAPYSKMQHSPNQILNLFWKDSRC